MGTGSGRKPLSNSYDIGLPSHVAGGASASTTIGPSPEDSWNVPGRGCSVSYEGANDPTDMMRTTGMGSMNATLGGTGRHSIGNSTVNNLNGTMPLSFTQGLKSANTAAQKK